MVITQITQRKGGEMKYLQAILIVLIVSYLIFAYCTLQVNPFAWNEGQRVGFVIANALVNLLVAVIMELEKKGK